MYKSKRDVDIHVQDIFLKVGSERERLTLCFNVAKQYANIKEFDSAKRYMESYLTTNPSNAPEAQKFMGDILNELGDREKALEYYKSSYQGGKTSEALNRICDLLENGYGARDPVQSRQKWFDLQKVAAEMATPSRLPHYNENNSLNSPFPNRASSNSGPPKTGFNYNSYTTSNSNNTSFSNSLSNSPRVASIPTNANMEEHFTKLIQQKRATSADHSNLLKLYLADRKIRTAVLHIQKYICHFQYNLDFLEQSIAVLEAATVTKHDQQQGDIMAKTLTDAELYSMFFFALDNLLGVHLDTHLRPTIPDANGEMRIIQAARLLHRFDQLLFTAGRRVHSSPLESWWSPFLKNCRAQLSFYIGCLILLRNEKDGFTKQERLYLPCFTLAASYVMSQPVSMSQLKESKLQIRAFIESCYRVFVSHVVLDCHVEELKKPTTFSKALREQIYERCFPARDQIRYVASSEFVNSLENTNSLPNIQPLNESNFWLYQKCAQLMYPASLHHQIWLSGIVLWKKKLDNAETLVHSVPFEDIPFLQTSDSCGADSISQIDVDAFLTTSTCIGWELHIKRQLKSNGRIKIPQLAGAIATPIQTKWWSNAYTLTHAMSLLETTTECRYDVQKGLELIRNQGKTLPLSLLYRLGSALSTMGWKLEGTDFTHPFLIPKLTTVHMAEIYFETAENYYTMVIDSQAKSNSGGSVVRFFEVNNFPEVNEIAAKVDAYFFIGWRSKERSDFETALNCFKETNFPEASMFSAEIYKTLADEEGRIGYGDTRKQKILLQQAQQQLYLTVDRKSLKPISYLVGKSNSSDIRQAPIKHKKIEVEMELNQMIDEVETVLKHLTSNQSLNRGLNISNGNINNSNGFSTDNFLEGEEGEDEVLENENFEIKTSLNNRNGSMFGVGGNTSGRMSRRSLGDSTVNTSTPRRSSGNNMNFSTSENVSGNVSFNARVQPSPERLNMQMRYLEKRYDDVLGKILEQNAQLLGTVQRIEEDVRLLTDKVETLSVTDVSTSQAEATQSGKSHKSIDQSDGRKKEVEKSEVGPSPNHLTQQQYPGSPYGYGYPYPSPYHPHFFMPDPSMNMGYMANPMLAALYGGGPSAAALFGNPLAAAGVAGAQVTTTTAETSLLAGLLSQNQHSGSVGTQLTTPSSVDTLYTNPQVQQQQIAQPIETVISSITNDKIWPQQTAPSASSFGTLFAASGNSTPPLGPSSSQTVVQPPVKSTPEKNSNAAMLTPPNPTSAVLDKGETPKSSTVSTYKDVSKPKPKSLFPENVVVSNTEKVPTIATAVTNTNVLSVTIPPEHRNTGSNNNSGGTPLGGTQVKNPNQVHNFQISAPAFKPQEPNFEDNKSEGTMNPFSNISLMASTPGFDDLAKNVSSTPTSFGNGTSFSGVGTPVFGNVVASISAAGVSTLKDSKERVEGEEGEDDFIPTAEFQPVIPLPPIVEVKKGDENENTVFEHRAKVYRFDKETREWKERGLGNIKILQDKDNPRKVRIVMWRERVLKLACNHWITKDIVVENHQGSAKVLKWTAVDFSEEEPKTEIFTCRFGQEDKCAEFKASMERMIQLIASEEDSPKKPEKKEAEKPKEKPKGTEKQKTLSELFKKPEGNWNCEICYVNNGKDVKVCVACCTPRPGCEVEVTKEETEKSGEAIPQFSFGFKTTTGVPTASSTPVSVISTPVFGFSTVSSTSTSSTSSFGTGLSGEKSVAGLSFSSPALSTPGSMVSFGATPSSTTSTTGSSSSSAFNFGAAVSDFKFNFKPTASETNVSVSSSGVFTLPVGVVPTTSKSFEDKTSTSFESNNTVGAKSNVTSVSEHDDDISDVEKEDASIQFQPIIPLPPLVELKTGEEDEEVVLQIRTKLFRLREREWKERALGDMKLLKHKVTGKYRLMMRRGTDKIGVNQPLVSELKLTLAKDEKSVMWGGVDFSEGDAQPDTFLLRFKTTVLAREFLDTVKAIVDRLDGDEGEVNSEADSSTTEVEVVFEKNLSPHLIAKATQLQLPLNFFAFETLSEIMCPGCRGCDPDSFDFTALDNRIPTNLVVNTPPSPIVDAPTSNSIILSPPKLITESKLYELLTPESSPKKENEQMKEVEPQKTDPKSAFSFTLGPQNDTPGSAGFQLKTPSFSFTSSVDPQTTSNAASSGSAPPSIFGEAASIPGGSLIGGAPSIFGGRAQSTSIFGGAPSLASNAPMAKIPQDTKPNPFSSFSFTSPNTSGTTDAVVTVSSELISSTSTPSLFSGTSIFANSKVAPDLTFGSLAQTSGTGFGFGDVSTSGTSAGFGQASANSTFMWSSSAKTVQVFVNQDTNSTKGETALNDSAQKEDEDNTGHEDETYDPHYEPVLSEPPPLVNEVTGEENHTQLYCQLAKTFRYDTDTKEWKERGVGDVKIIKNNENSNIRLVQWRRQVKTLACNHYILPEMDLKMLKNCPKSWCWGAKEFSDKDFPEGRDEQFAIRFKDEETAKVFKEMFDKCKLDMQEIRSRTAVTVPVPETVDQPQVVETLLKPVVPEIDNSQNDDQDEDDEDEEEEECMFENDANFYVCESLDTSSNDFVDLGQGQVRVIYDGEHFCARLLFMSNENCLIDHFIATETTLKPGGDMTFEWVGVSVTEEQAVKSRLKVKFPDQQAYDSFSSTMSDSVDLAMQAGVTEGYLLGEDDGGDDEQ